MEQNHLQLSELGIEAPAPRVEGEASPALALQFDIHARLRSAKADYAKGKALFEEVEVEMRNLNDKRATIARELMRIEGAIAILTEQGARDE